MASASRNSSDRGGVRRINISPRPIRWDSVMKRSLVLFTSDFAMVLSETRGDRWPDVPLWKAAD
jgi:hypothetical protein